MSNAPGIFRELFVELPTELFRQFAEAAVSRAQATKAARRQAPINVLDLVHDLGWSAGSAQHDQHLRALRLEFSCAHCRERVALAISDQELRAHCEPTQLFITRLPRHACKAAP